MKSALACTLVVICTGAALGDETPVVGEVSVEGNSRTRTNVILRAARVAPGTPFTDSLRDDVRQRVYNLRVFDTVIVEPSRRDGVTSLTIHVTERWTLLPIPFASVADDVYRVGAFIVDTNFLGRAKTGAAGGYYGNRGSGGFLYYMDPDIAGTRWELVAQTAYFGARRQRYDEGVEVDAFHEERAELATALGYRVLRPLSIFVGWTVAEAHIDSDDGFPATPREGGLLQGPSLTFELDASDFQLYFQAGVQNRLRFETAFEALGSVRSFLRVTDRFQAATRMAWDHALIAIADLQIETSDALLDAFLAGGQPGTRGFHNQGLWATRLATLALEYHIPVWRPGWGVWTVLGFVDAGALDGQSGPKTFVQPGAGFRMFLRQIALPALGVDMTYSLEEHSFWAAVAVGFKI